MSRLHEAAPVLSLALALLVPLWLRHEAAGVLVGTVEQAAVAAAVEAVPYRIGKWAGLDVPIPEAAGRLLRPNAMLCRRFIHLERGTVMDFLFIHCGDSRDMLGHYPPVCYPSNGWVSSAGSERSQVRHGDRIECMWHDRTFPARLYTFSRRSQRQAGLDWSETSIRVLNFFILPDGTVTSDIEDVSLRTHWLGAAVHGIAQVQVLTYSRTTETEAMEAAREILEGVSSLLETLGVKRSW